MTTARKNKMKWAAIITAAGASLAVVRAIYGWSQALHEVGETPARVDRLEERFASVETNNAVIRLEWEVFRTSMGLQLAEIMGSQRRQEEILKIIRNYMQIEINRQATNR